MGVGTNQARDLGIQVLAYAGEHDGHDTGCPRCIAANLLAEVERLREDNVALRRAWRVDSDGQHETNVRLADERDRLREEIDDLANGPYYPEDVVRERLRALLGDPCTHESVDTFGSGAGRRVDVCMGCHRVLRFWNANTETA